RIELGEIETVLNEHPAVRQNVVTVREDELGNKRLVAYIVANADTRNDVNDASHRNVSTELSVQLHLWVSTKVPEYMVPQVFVLLDALPLTSNGKIDRKKLPAPTQGSDAEEYVAPRTLTEQKVAEIWSDILKAPRIGVRDNF